VPTVGQGAGKQRRDRPDVVEVAVGGDDGLRGEPATPAGRAPQRIPGRRASGHSELQQEPVVDELRAPADLAGATEKRKLHAPPCGLSYRSVDPASRA